MSHHGTEETLLDEGETASGLWGVLVLGSGFCLVFVFGFGVACVLFPSSCCVSFPFNDDLGTLPTWRPHSWKNIRFLGQFLAGIGVVFWSPTDRIPRHGSADAHDPINPIQEVHSSRDSDSIELRLLPVLQPSKLDYERQGRLSEDTTQESRSLF